MLARLIEILSRLNYIALGVPMAIEEKLAEARLKKEAVANAVTRKAETSQALTDAQLDDSVAAESVTSTTTELVAAVQAVHKAIDEEFTVIT